jgi:hypothetical protein
MELSDDWEAFLSQKPIQKAKAALIDHDAGIPEPSPIYVSTKTLILYLSRSRLDLREIFWGLPVLPYDTEATGVIEKQMKVQSKTAEEVEEIRDRLRQCPYANMHVMAQSTAKDAEFKHICKVTIGLSRKSVRATRLKLKGAFYNCFVAIVRIQVEGGDFREFHVKVFNTGKVEIPGIQTDEHLYQVVAALTTSLNKVVYIAPVPRSEEIVLINSNFNCNYFIHREKLYDLLREKYGFAAIYDPCSYPGIQCKLFALDGSVRTTSARGAACVSVMIFRTGSILIVGKCDVDTLDVVYRYLNGVFREEYAVIMDPNCIHAVKKPAKAKRFRKFVQLSKKS